MIPFYEGLKQAWLVVHGYLRRHERGLWGLQCSALDLGAGCTGVATLWPSVKLYAYERYIFLYIEHTLIRSLLKKRNNYREEIHGKYKLYYWNGTLNSSLSPVSQWERPAQKASFLQFSLSLLHFPALTTKMDACLPHVMRINKLTEHLLFANEFAGPRRQWQVRAGCSRNWQAGTTCDHLPPAPAPSVMFCTEWAFHQRWLISTATTAESKGSYRWST